MTRTLYAGPFDGFVYGGPTVDFIELDAVAGPVPGAVFAPGEQPAPSGKVRYIYRADTNRYEWEGLHDGR